MINIHLLQVLAHASIYIVLYFIFDFLYFITHQNYKWHQYDNICYDDKKYFALIWAGIIYVVILLFYYGIIKISL